ncbi:hypothetical protein GUJ93_ZPchr0002g26490 [Zizania palustris]|uniref:Uncharacterized protein n=1 Tax=Zizania palustris TaxID=103762 RepID=A0A8J5VBV6_ZIZPA|nr:hypothetical protein GUJ93_ZPchr0002g26490 [Zizania palustris]
MRRRFHAFFCSGTRHGRQFITACELHYDERSFTLRHLLIIRWYPSLVTCVIRGVITPVLLATCSLPLLLTAYY